MFIQLKPISLCIILAEVLDIITTAVGIYLIPGTWELNPMVYIIGGLPVVFFIKIPATLLIVGSIQKVYFTKKIPKIYWSLPLIAVLPGFWNIFVITFESLVKF